MPIINNKLNGDASIRCMVSNTVPLFDLAKPFGAVLPGTIATNTTANAVTGTNTLFQRDFSVGDWIFLTGNSTFTETREVASVTSNTALTLTTNATVTNASTTYQKAEKVEWASITYVDFALQSNATTGASANVARGANTLLNLYGTDHWDFAAAYCGALNEDNGGSFVITITGVGTVILGVSKKSRLPGNTSVMV